MFLVPIPVESHSGYKEAEEPRAFVWLGNRVEVREILDRWYEGSADPRQPPRDYFKVSGSDDREYLLSHDRQRDQWYLVESLGQR